MTKVSKTLLALPLLIGIISLILIQAILYVVLQTARTLEHVLHTIITRIIFELRQFTKHERNPNMIWLEKSRKKTSKGSNTSESYKLSQQKPILLPFLDRTLKEVRLLLLKLRARYQNLSTKTSSPKHVKKVGVFRKLFAALLAIFLIGITIGSYVLWKYVLKDLPEPRDLAYINAPVSSRMYDRNGILLYELYGSSNRTIISLSEVPTIVKQATLASEDAEFYDHFGFSIRGMTRAFLKNWQEGRIEGGSTITQQLVKNKLLTSEKTYMRKLKEFFLALEVEYNYNKDQILEMYLNQVSYGGPINGIAAASLHYFDKPVSELTLSESAFLAGLPRSPSQYAPINGRMEASLERKNIVLNLMKVNGFITPDEYDMAVDKPIVLKEKPVVIEAPHFVFYVEEELEKKFGKEVLITEGFQIKTSVDLNLQNMAQKIVAEEVEKLRSFRVSNAAAIVMNPQTGEVLAMVGSKDYFNKKADGEVNVTTRLRQPGSSIKLVNYAYALSHGSTAATTLEDTPMTFKIPGQDDYIPKNYDGNFRGPLPLRSALAESRNLPAVRLLHSYGVDKMLDLGRDMGITTWNDRRGYGLSLTLGGGETQLLDMARVYATVANNGVRPKTMPVISISDRRNHIVDTRCLTAVCEEKRVLDPGVAFILADILRDNTARSPAFGTNSLLNIKGHPEVSVKTGTSNDLRDNLAIGFTKDYVVAVWVGNNDNSPMSRIASGITGATPIFNRIMTELLQGRESYTPTPPTNISQVAICPYTGTLPCDGCPRKMEYFIKGTEPKQFCSPEWFKVESAEDENNPDDQDNGNNGNGNGNRGRGRKWWERFDIIN